MLLLEGTHSCDSFPSNSFAKEPVTRVLFTVSSLHIIYAAIISKISVVTGWLTR